jgi:hypothetical protein
MPWRARCRETGTAGSASGLEKRTGSNPGTALQADSTMSFAHFISQRGCALGYKVSNNAEQPVPRRLSRSG